MSSRCARVSLREDEDARLVCDQVLASHKGVRRKGRGAKRPKTGGRRKAAGTLPHVPSKIPRNTGGLPF